MAARGMWLKRLSKPQFSFVDVRTAKAAIIGDSEVDPDLGKMDDFYPLFPDFRGRSFVSLLWELRETHSEKESLSSAIVAMSEALRFVRLEARQIVTEQSEEGASTWKFRPGLAEDFSRTVLEPLTKAGLIE